MENTQSTKREPTDIVRPSIEFIVRFAEILLMIVAFGVAAERLNHGGMRVVTALLAVALFWHLLLGIVACFKYIRRVMFPHRGGSRKLWMFAVVGTILCYTLIFASLVSAAASIERLMVVSAR